MRPASVPGIVTTWENADQWLANLPFAHLPQYTLFALHKFCISMSSISYGTTVILKRKEKQRLYN